jgi:predicted solute-binding protein
MFSLYPNFSGNNYLAYFSDKISIGVTSSMAILPASKGMNIVKLMIAALSIISVDRVIKNTKFLDE